MRSADAARRALAAAILIVGSVQAAETQYGKVETFQPGKKYTCLPTADHKGWDCREAAPKDGTAAAQAVQPATASAAAAPIPTPAAPAAAAGQPPTNGASVPPQPPSDNTASISPAATPAPRPSGLPPYLRAPAARAPSAAPSTPANQPDPQAPAVAPPESTISRVEPTPAGQPQAPVQATPPQPAAAIAADLPPTAERANAAVAVPSPKAPAHDAPHVEPTTAAHESAKVESPAASRVDDQAAPGAADTKPLSMRSAATPPVAPAPEATHSETTPPTPAPGATSRSGNNDFLALPASGYIVDLAHGSNKSDLYTLRASLHPAHGALYELNLLRDATDWWLLVWGTFDSVDAARAARGDLPSDTPLNAGWRGRWRRCRRKPGGRPNKVSGKWICQRGPAPHGNRFSQSKALPDATRSRGARMAQNRLCRRSHLVTRPDAL